MTELFHRRAIVDVGPGGGEGLHIDSLGPSGEAWSEGMQIAFDVQKTIQSDANRAVVKLYNLERDSQARIEAGGVLRLSVGYGAGVELAYEGDVTRVQTERSGADMITTVECGDGVETFKAQEIKRTFPAGASVKKVVEAVARQFLENIPDPARNPVVFGKPLPAQKPSRLSIATLDRDLAVLERSLKDQGFATVLRRPMSVSGNARDVMDRMAVMWRFDWSVQDGAIQVIAYGASTAGVALVVSAESGLINTPVQTLTGVKLQTLILPQLRPGATIELVSERLLGTYRTETVRLDGDTRGASWYADVEARSA